MLIWKANEIGIPVSVLRPGNIGHPQTGKNGINDYDFQTKLVGSFVKLGVAPDSGNWRLEATAVDYLADSIVKIARNSSCFESQNNVFNVVENEGVQAAELGQNLKRNGIVGETIE